MLRQSVYIKVEQPGCIFEAVIVSVLCRPTVAPECLDILQRNHGTPARGNCRPTKSDPIAFTGLNHRLPVNSGEQMMVNEGRVQVVADTVLIAVPQAFFGVRDAIVVAVRARLEHWRLAKHPY